MKRILLIFLFLCLAVTAQALTFKESIDFAQKHSPTILASQKKFDAANAKLNQAVGSFFPNLKLNGNYMTQTADPQIVEFDVGGTRTKLTAYQPSSTRSWNAAISQPLLQVGLIPGLKMAQRNADSAYQDLQKAMQETSYNVTVTYFGVLSADKLAKVADEALALARSHLNQVQIMNNNGAATRADLLRTEVQVANSEVALTKARNDLELAKNSFNNALGAEIDAAVEVNEEISAAIPVLPDYKNLLQLAFANRPDWLGFGYNKEVAEANLALSKTAYLPTINLNGQTGNQTTNFPGASASANSTSLTGVASWTLFDGLGIQNRINEAAANLEATKANEEQTRNNIILDVRNAFLNLKNSIETIGSTKKAVDLAVESQKLSTQRYNSGVGTNVEVIDAQVTLTRAKTDHLNALFSLAIAKAKIKKVVGKEVL